MKIRAVEYEIEFDDGSYYFLVECKQIDGEILWKIMDRCQLICLSRDLKFDFEPTNSSRTNKYLKNTRFKYEEAIDILLKFKAQDVH